MISLKTKRRPPNPPLSAMSDIGFIMLIFIMLLSLINYRREVEIDYPEADQVERTEADHQLEIWIDSDGTVIVDGQTLGSVALQQEIAAAISAHPDVRIHIIADRNTPYQNVNGVIQILQLLQHRVVSFVVKENL